MARTFEYAVLTAMPDPRRGERANVGVIVFRRDDIDVRFSDQAVYKLKALTGENLASRLESAEALFKKMFSKGEKASDLVKLYQGIEPILQASDLGWFRADTNQQYEDRLAEVIQSLVSIPPRPPVESKSRINTEMGAEFKRLKILASKGEGIEEGKVVRNFHIGGDEDLVADFALKNGKFHIASTLDLRKQGAGMSEAALKSVILDRAKETFKKKAKTIGVFAIDAGMYENFRRPLKLFENYAEELFDWQDPKRRKALNKMLLDAIAHSPDGLL